MMAKDFNILYVSYSYNKPSLGNVMYASPFKGGL